MTRCAFAPHGASCHWYFLHLVLLERFEGSHATPPPVCWRCLLVQREMDTLFATILDDGHNVVGAAKCSLFFVDEEKGEVWTKVATDNDGEIKVSLDVQRCSPTSLGGELTAYVLLSALPRRLYLFLRLVRVISSFTHSDGAVITSGPASCPVPLGRPMQTGKLITIPITTGIVGEVVKTKTLRNVADTSKDT